VCLFSAARVIVKGSLVSVTSLSCCSFLWFSWILPALAYGGTSDNRRGWSRERLGQSSRPPWNIGKKLYSPWFCTIRKTTFRI